MRRCFSVLARDIVAPKNWALGLSIFLLIVAGASAAGLAYFLDNIGRTPQEWAPYIIQRAEGHCALVTGAAATAAVTYPR